MLPATVLNCAQACQKKRDRTVSRDCDSSDRIAASMRARAKPVHALTLVGLLKSSSGCELTNTPAFVVTPEHLNESTVSSCACPLAVYFGTSALHCDRMLRIRQQLLDERPVPCCQDALAAEY